MDSEALHTIATRALSKLKARRIEVLDCTPDSARIRVLCDGFQKQSVTERFEHLYDLLYDRNQLPKTFLVEFEAWTPSEYESLEPFLAEVKSGGGSGSRKIAAAPQD